MFVCPSIYVIVCLSFDLRHCLFVLRFTSLFVCPSIYVVWFPTLISSNISFIYIHHESNLITNNKECMYKDMGLWEITFILPQEIMDRIGNLWLATIYQIQLLSNFYSLWTNVCRHLRARSMTVIYTRHSTTTWHLYWRKCTSQWRNMPFIDTTSVSYMT